ncbi:MAG: hypothetical protein AB8G99_18435 [Planctomycetaceae bacterium]
MSEELVKVVCGQCDGKMRVRKVGHAVVCPHCSSHLRVTDAVETGASLTVESGSGVLDRVTSRSGVLRKGSDVAKSPETNEAEVSRKLFLLIASYASAVTIALAWLLFSGRTHPLESLPDVRTLAADELEFVGLNTPLPAGHTLALNETRRFGDVLITPLRVTREPIEFEHYENKSATRPPTGNVLKLWIKFENLADDVAFPPYDTALMSRRVRVEGDTFDAKANTFLCSADQPRTLENVVLNYEHQFDSEWNIAQQPTQPLSPGSQLTTFAASAEEIPKLNGDLVWRIQFRKGINRSTRRGVTTLVDITFKATDIL